MTARDAVRLVVVGELLDARRPLHPDTRNITVGQMAALYEAVARARTDLSDAIGNRAGAALELYPALTLVKVAFVAAEDAEDADVAAVLKSLADAPDAVGRGGVTLRCVTRAGRVPRSVAVEEFCRLMATLPAPYRRGGGGEQSAPLTEAPAVDALPDHGQWRGGPYAHARVAAELADCGLHQLGPGWLCVRIDGAGALRSIAAAGEIADLRVAARRWTDWFASLGEHAAVRGHRASVIMSVSDDAVLLVPRRAAGFLETDLRRDFERCFPQSTLRWAEVGITESSTPYSIARSYHAMIRTDQKR